MEEYYLRPDVCAACGGKCCRSMPGEAFPEDFEGGSYDAVLAALKTGNWAVDWWEGDPREGSYELRRGYYLRPRTIGAHDILDPSWGGPCVFWMPSTGCELEPKDRPRSCRELEPVAGGGCVIHDGSGKHAAALAWLPFTDVILIALEACGENPHDSYGDY